MIIKFEGSMEIITDKQTQPIDFESKLNKLKSKKKFSPLLSNFFGLGNVNKILNQIVNQIMNQIVKHSRNQVLNQISNFVMLANMEILIMLKNCLLRIVLIVIMKKIWLFIMHVFMGIWKLHNGYILWVVLYTSR